MKTFRIFISLITLSLISSTISAQEFWNQKNDFPNVARAWAVSFSIGNMGYLGTGGSSSSTRNDFWEYNPSTDTWSQKANVGGGGRVYAVGFSIENKGYIGLGISGSNSKNDFWEYDVQNNTWTQKTNFPGQGRAASVGFSIADKGYVGTGSPTTTIGNETNEFWEYNPSNDEWTAKADFAGGVRDRAVAFSIGEKGYIGTGYHFTGSDVINYNDFWEYDPSADTWSAKLSLPGSGRSSATSFSIGQYGYVGMGYLDLTDFWKYNQDTELWSEVSSFEGEGRIGVTGLSIENKGYVGMGYYVTQADGGVFLGDFWEFEDSTLTVDDFDKNAPNSLIVYPNPTKDRANIKTIIDGLIIKKITVYDINGKIMLVSNDEHVNIASFSTGVYFLDINTSKGTIKKHIIKKD